MRSIALLCDDKYTSTRNKMYMIDKVYEKHMKVQYMKSTVDENIRKYNMTIQDEMKVYDKICKYMKSHCY